jgi:hypothetical protein
MASVSLQDRLILGFNPLLGMDHYLRERSRDPQRIRSRSEVIEVVAEAVHAGAQGFNLNSGPETARLLTELGQRGLDHEVGLYPIVPDERFFGSLLNHGTIGAASAVLSGLSVAGRAKALLSGGWAYLTHDPFRAVDAYFGIEIERLDRAARGFGKVRTLLVHELITDALVGIGATEPLVKFVDLIQTNYAIPPGFVTRNLCRFVNFAKEAGIDPRSLVLLTPVNSAGFQMAPSREAVEGELASLGGENVIAMSIFGAGMIPISEALDYLRKIRGVRSVAVGVSTKEHARTTFTLLQSVATLAH